MTGPALLEVAYRERAALDGVSLRAAALQLSEKNLEAIQSRFG
jgi:glutamate dehydrogenase (NAD(P)+)